MDSTRPGLTVSPQARTALVAPAAQYRRRVLHFGRGPRTAPCPTASLFRIGWNLSAIARSARANVVFGLIPSAPARSHSDLWRLRQL